MGGYGKAVGRGMPGPYRAAIFAAGGASSTPCRGQDPSLQYLWEKQVPFGLLSGRGRACPAPTGWQFLQRAAPSTPGGGVKTPPYSTCGKAGAFWVIERRGETCPARLWMVYGWLWESPRAGHARPLQGGNFLQRAAVAMTVMGRPVKAPPVVCGAAAHLHHSAGASVASGCAVSSGCGAFASRYA